jgi:hypothetical protein
MTSLETQVDPAPSDEIDFFVLLPSLAVVLSRLFLVSLASAKIVSVLLGPSGYGYLGLLQGLLGTGSLLVGMGVSYGPGKRGGG